MSPLLLHLLLFGLGIVTGCHGRLWDRTAEADHVVGESSRIETAVDVKYGKSDIKCVALMDWCIHKKR